MISSDTPVYGGHFLFSGGGLCSIGGLASKSFNKFAVNPVGWLCPICKGKLFKHQWYAL